MNRLAIALMWVVMVGLIPAVEAQDRGKIVLERGSVRFEPDAQGNRVPDFSYCGYASGEKPIPMATVRVVVTPVEGDNTARLQAAINYVSALPVGDDGLRGAVLLQPGRYAVGGGLRISASGLVLRGSGVDQTVLVATGTDRRTLITVTGAGAPATRGEPVAIRDDYVPVNAMGVKVVDPSRFKVGDRVLIRRPCTQAWIDALGTDDFGGDRHGPKWKPGSRELVWDRTVVGIDGALLRLDAPITTAMEKRFGGGTVVAYDWAGRIEQVGVENLRCESTFDAENPKDEAHAWFAITMSNVVNAWVRQVNMAHFAGGAVALWETASRVTVEDCKSLRPVSEIGGFRRYTFQTLGQMNLFQRCLSEQGWHDFAAGFCAAGPNAFVQCEAVDALNSSGGINSWASGVLYDNVSIDGQALGFENLWSRSFGAGWSAANSMLWQCSASMIRNQAPPTANNWAVGCWGEFSGDGHFQSSNESVNPRSLYYAQLAERIGQEAIARAALLPFTGESTSAPTIEMAAEMSQEAKRPALGLSQWIDQAAQREPVSIDAGNAPDLASLKLALPTTAPATQPHLASIHNGWLVAGGAVMVGDRSSEVWWSGSLLPEAVKEARPAITRFVPGRVGTGLTDDLDAVAEEFSRRGTVLMQHHYGLWYERRRDDHERVRRIDGDVWAPFYEQPFARSGVGTAWDGLSRYDLTRYNPWYWARLKRFVELGEQKGFVLFHQHFFQHNILEAGAHWVDSPWRPANAIQQTHFVEPPNFAGGKRIFYAEQFYDVGDPVRRELYTAYIRQCLSNFAGQHNVIQSISAEFTGPLHFVQFWLDVIGQWEQETGEHPLVALSTPRDVQDAILADDARASRVDIIDINYWWYQPDGKAYAPPGGKNLAPRQFVRLMKPKGSSPRQVARAVREYRLRYPRKVVMYSAEGSQHGWAVLAGGGSLAQVPATTDPALLRRIVEMAPIAPREADDLSVFILGSPRGDYLLYAPEGGLATLDLSGDNGQFAVRSVDSGSGQANDAAERIEGGKVVTFQMDKARQILWLVRQR